MTLFILGAFSMLLFVWALAVSLILFKVRKAILGLTTAIEILATPDEADSDNSEPIGFHIT